MKIVFDLARPQVVIEGDGPDLLSILQAVREVAPKISEIRLVTSPIKAAAAETRDGGGEGANGQREVAPRGAPGMREFARSLSPRTLTERIAVIAAYAARFDGRESFSPKEMSDWFTICGFQKPSQMSVALFDAKRKYGYLESPGHGRWKLSTAGENAVTRKMEEAPSAA